MTHEYYYQRQVLLELFWSEITYIPIQLLFFQNRGDFKFSGLDLVKTLLVVAKELGIFGKGVKI